MASAWAAILSSRGLLVVVAALAWTARAAALPRNGTSSFTLRLTWEPRAPAGIPRRMLLVNGQSPGPVLALDQDDWVEVHVVNASPFDTTIHFHGASPLGPLTARRPRALVPCLTARPQASRCSARPRPTASPA